MSNSISSTPHTSQRVVIVANQLLFKRHWTGEGHPEAPQRVEAIEQALREANLMDQNNTLSPRQATFEEIGLCHSKAYQQELNKQIERLQHQGKRWASFDNRACQAAHVPGDFQISADTLNVALYAAGAPLTAIEYILNQENQTSRAFCIVRPPGHHAHSQTGSGFCVFNNVAIAAKHLVQHLGFQRVLIVDWDAHHGDGTQDLIENDGRIFYFSTHKDTARGFYPGPHWGRREQQGVKENVLNCPVTGSAKECREGILSAFRNQLIPVMEKYRPDFVLISCGFDAHKDDSLVGLGLTDEDYREMTKICVKIAEQYAQGRIVSVLEGGYNLEAIASAAKVHVETLKHAQ
jgi:acetoin utilization deacetylase AcuC-like enzyme